jgi:hypothetical protein
LSAKAETIVWADGPPPAPVDTDGISYISNNSAAGDVYVELWWKGIDAIDSLSTDFRCALRIDFPGGDSKVYYPDSSYMTVGDTFGGSPFKYVFEVPADVLEGYTVGDRGYCVSGAPTEGRVYGSVWLRDRHGRVRSVHTLGAGPYLCY